MEHGTDPTATSPSASATPAPSTATPPLAPPPPTYVLTHPKHPGTFCGTDQVDVDDWIADYERTSALNRYDPTLMLANVLFYLKGTAKVWYENHEEEIGSWDTFKEKLRDLFGKPIGRKAAAKKELSIRAQTSTEPYISYIQDVLALCRKVDNDMSESDKVGHVLKGIADDAFNLLMCRNCATVDEIIEECRRFELAKSRRISRSFTRLPNTAATSSCEDGLSSHRQSSPASEITRIVRREIEAITPTLPANGHVDLQVPQVCLVQSIVREELSNLGFDVCAVAQSRPIGFRSRSPPRPRSPPQERSYPRSRNPAEWRTADDRPICFNCRRIGHVARYCHNHWSSSRNQYNTARRTDSYRRFQPPEPIADNYRRPLPVDSYACDAPDTQHSRSPSPRRHQSRSPPGRRPSSPSPLRRRPTSPLNSHQGN